MIWQMTMKNLILKKKVTKFENLRQKPTVSLIMVIKGCLCGIDLDCFLWRVAKQ